MTKARCALMARSGGGDFAAIGSPAFVAGAATGAAIGSSIRINRDFNDCLLASGWKIADALQSSTPSSGSTAAPNTFPVVAFSPDHRVQVILPAGWTKADAPSSPATADIEIYAANSQIGTVLALRKSPKIDIGDLARFSETTRQGQIAKIQGAIASNLDPLTFGGKQAYRYDVFGSVGGINIHYLSTIVDTGSFVVRLSEWTVQSKFEDARPEFERIARTVQELPAN